MNANWHKGPVDAVAVCHMWGVDICHTQVLHRHPALAQRAVTAVQLTHSAKCRANPTGEPEDIMPMQYNVALEEAELCPLCPRLDATRNQLPALHGCCLSCKSIESSDVGHVACDQCREMVTSQAT